MTYRHFVLLCILIGFCTIVDGCAERRRHKEVLQAIQNAHVETFDLRVQLSEPLFSESGQLILQDLDQ